VRKESKIAVRGKVKGHFELHFGGILEKDVIITRRLCNAWNETASVFILNGKRSDKEFINLFEGHFKIKLEKSQTIHELCVKWSAWDEWIKRNDENWEETHPS
jgi:hypothetical protein